MRPGSLPSGYPQRPAAWDGHDDVIIYVASVGEAREGLTPQALSLLLLVTDNHEACLHFISGERSISWALDLCEPWYAGSESCHSEHEM